MRSADDQRPAMRMLRRAIAFVARIEIALSLAILLIGLTVWLLT
jgi:hypothetical protein